MDDYEGDADTLDRALIAARHSIRQILEWDFQKIILAHGPFILSIACIVFEKAFSWLP